jgi:hypothetical protein
MRPLVAKCKASVVTLGGRYHSKLPRIPGLRFLLPVAHNSFAEPMLEELYHVGPIEGCGVGMREVVPNEREIEIDAISP